MLQSIQFNGSGPPTYVYSQKSAESSAEFYYILAAETKRYDGKREHGCGSFYLAKEKQHVKAAKQEEWDVLEDSKSGSLQEIYQREYGRRESFLWKQR